MVVVLDVGQDVDFVDCALFEFFVLSEFGYRDYFDRVLLFVVVVDRAVHFAVDARADLVVQSVVFDILDHIQCFLMFVFCICTCIFVFVFNSII